MNSVTAKQVTDGCLGLSSLSSTPGAADVSPGVTLGGVKGSAGGGLSAMVHTEPRGPWWRLWIRTIPDMLFFIVGIDT